MKVRTYSLAVVLTAFAVGAAPALAQSPREGGSPAAGGGDRAGGGGSGNSGNAGGGGGAAGGVATGGGGGGASSSSSGGGASFSSPSGLAATSPNLSFGDRAGRQTAPQRRAEFAGWASSSGAASDGQSRPRTASGSGGSSGSGERAVPRGNGASSGRDAGNGNSGEAARTRTAPPPREAGASSEGNPNNTSGAREVPNWSRPRGDRPASGVAVERTGPPPNRDNSYYRGGRYYDPYYYGYGYSGYYSGYYPYTFGLGYGLYSGLGWNPYFGDPFDPYYMGSGGYSSGIYSTVDQGNLKLKVKPRNAKVYVDGFFVGLVDEFDGAFQKLALNSGRHKVEVRAEGFETAEFDVLISPDQTVTFQGELKRIQ